MSKRIFTYKPDLEGAVGDFKSVVTVVKFGDGYEQRRAHGVNTKFQTWTLQKTGKAATLAPIKAFFDAVNGLESFLWIPPNGAQITVLLDDGYQETPKGGGIYQLSWTFRQVYE